ncbi:NAD(P)H-dependent glycerol-3-phosphate dehydrogenase [Zavarzinia compransoris]|uniref:Glycerol-3-phosphate dehydrogenase [NAD(P)+] n=1 Tax=Zavarzinia compransoris TaxID=1264899 RepID=A0A317DZ63_9PROT|nr:NAD(P)H-dependent glycerol-3-phosphate dehydrogenase [Zavarzinia compransoris]PWR20077.1 glycerol-3-phosphate dehydrogenase [Zavarzinia compransoris]TDP44799.1 glycerol-3-phosphate dehydrogenase (NAD(P)+) [Zavarzinia compransoris]
MSAGSGTGAEPRPFERIAIVGAGAWGTALALTAHRAGRGVALWAREASVVEAVARDRRNPFLPAPVDLPAAIAVTGDLPAVVAGADLVLMVTPSQHLRRMLGEVAPLLGPAVPVVICAKGVEGETGALMSAVGAAALPGRPLAVLSGPTFATEVALDLPTAVTVAARGDHGFGPDHLAARVAVTFATRHFRPYLSDDLIGVEIGGAVKNVIAIACGIAAGKGLGSNARAALITRGLAELTRLGVAVGARSETLGGLAGVGDLVLTCSSEQSRNFSFGKALGEGRRAALTDDGPVVEGAVNAAAVVALARRLGIAMPICLGVEAILNGAAVDDIMAGLMTGDLKPEALAAEKQFQIPHPAL